MQRRRALQSPTLPPPSLDAWAQECLCTSNRTHQAAGALKCTYSGQQFSRRQTAGLNSGDHIMVSIMHEGLLIMQKQAAQPSS